MTQPATTLDRAAALLDTLARTSTTMPVAVRCLLAAELLCKAGATPTATGRGAGTDRDLLRQALRLLAASTTPELDDVILEATHHALLAHAAAPAS